jgi:hypothetical protein
MMGDSWKGLVFLFFPLRPAQQAFRCEHEHFCRRSGKHDFVEIMSYL